MADLGDLQFRVDAINRSGLSIYDLIPRQVGKLWTPTFDLARLLNASMKGIALADLPLRTRSKVVKKHVCRALGYPVPRTFRRTQPRFPGQHFDVYVQKSDNLQIWNEELDPTRRYVIVRVGADETIVQVSVVTGEDLARLDTTGTLTQKYQARMARTRTATALVVESDTTQLQAVVNEDVGLSSDQPTDLPRAGGLLSIGSVFDKLQG